MRFTRLFSLFSLFICFSLSAHEESSILGREWVDTLHEEYQKGVWDPFLKEIQADYKKAEKQGEFAPFEEIAMKVEQDDAVAFDLKAHCTHLKEKLKRIMNQRNCELAGLCLRGSSDLVTFQRIQSILSFHLTAKEKEEIEFAFPLHLPPKGDKVASLHREFYFKSLLLDKKHAALSFSPFLSLREKTVLDWERLRRLRDVLGESEEEKMEEVSSLFLEKRAFQFDETYLTLLASGQLKPRTLFEKEVQTIVKKAAHFKQEVINENIASLSRSHPL